MVEVRLVVNGRDERLAVEDRELLGHVLRERLGCRGVHVACGEGACGACTVLVDGQAVRSCLMLAAQADGHRITTLAGITTTGGRHPLQEALERHGGVQCGYCTSGILLATLSYAAEEPLADENGVREMLAGHICRCTGYEGIVRGITEYLASRRPDGGRPT